MEEERFRKEKTKEEIFNDGINFLDKAKESTEDLRFNFACFVDCFKKYINKMDKNGN